MLLSYFERPLCVNCDWLSFSVKFDPMGVISLPSGLRAEKLNGTNVFRERWIIYNQSGAKMMTICCNPYSPVLRDDIASCQIANPWLYNPDVEFLASVFHGFKNAVFHGLSRWDVCCDFCPTDAEYKTIRKLTSGGQYVSGKSEGSLFWHSERYGNKDYRMAHCMSWGRATSALKIKLYNKSLEINATNRELCSKPYILDEWEHNLPDISKVWRLEFSWTDVNQLAIDDRRLGFEDALSSDILVRFFSEVKAKRFIIRMNQGRREGHKNNDEIVPFLPFDMDKVTIRRADPISCREPLDEQRALARHIWMHLSDRYVLCDDDRYNTMRNILCDMASDAAICGYLDSLCNGSFASWILRLDDNRGLGIFDMIDSDIETSPMCER